MHIEVAVHDGVSSTVRGSLLEQLVEEFLEAQNYEVFTQIRKIGSELDIVCRHKVNRKEIYVECKAYRETLSAVELRKLLGTIEFEHYEEGWLISTGPLGKDAKGWQNDWENRPTRESQKLSIYTPERIIGSLIASKVIKPFPNIIALDIVKDENLLGEGMLLVTEAGTYWVMSCLSGGVPSGVLVFSSKTGLLIEDSPLLKNLSKTDNSLSTLDFEYYLKFNEQTSVSNDISGLRKVIEVQIGDTWSDYRPSKPEHFVGRMDAQTNIMRFLDTVISKESNTRIFAIRGDSGMGKSSLIAKIRSKVKNKMYRKKFFIYAVDVRAATGGTYIHWSLLSCFRKAASHGFGYTNSDDIRISNATSPLESDSIQLFLSELEKKEEVVCLVFDQFEELYSKPDLFDVFDVAKRLFLDTAALKSNFVLGFAWKNDSTVQQDNSAYFFWQSLADHRREIYLAPFNHTDVSAAITIFEKELGEKIHPDLRRQLIENSQGYPWLLKKLCIHVYDQVRSGVSQIELINKALDVKSLFDRDLQNLTQAENTCLKIIAETAPADWYEILESSGQEILRNLLDKRLVVRSGDRVNLYWDIFKEYVLTQTIPFIPLTYLPSSPSIQKMLQVALYLDHDQIYNYTYLGNVTKASEKTVGNIIRDLIMFGAAKGSQSQVLLDQSVPSSSPIDILRRLRHVFKRHALTIELSKNKQDAYITLQDIITILKQINPAAQHNENTWKVYAERMLHWLLATGYVVENDNDWIFKDKGDVVITSFRKVLRRVTKNAFLSASSPAKTLEAFQWLNKNQPQSRLDIKIAGYRNAIMILRSLKLVKNEKKLFTTIFERNSPDEDLLKLLWQSINEDRSIQNVLRFMQNNPYATGSDIGRFINQEYKKNWTTSSEQRNGNVLRKWGIWLLEGSKSDNIINPISKSDKEKFSNLQIRIDII
ncbi:restriction endonuclease [Herpetosiphon geysericola]|uniref:Uncharacterized protein n=1 Tax=Herpetosiphon geysericola TaxID=70996 RepID=A0A0P6YBM1_9CHLR|nr:restriction endonuclease [Herpetosiphon geysericola]KPL87561.1 hypothetical protein SE18_10895 [Herpetosiphon geysericola]